MNGKCKKLIDPKIDVRTLLRNRQLPTSHMEAFPLSVFPVFIRLSQWKRTTHKYCCYYLPLVIVLWFNFHHSCLEEKIK